MSTQTSTAVVRKENKAADVLSWTERLPGYFRSLLKIEVPVTVTLATTKLAVGDIVGLVPGTILQFEKMCDETLSPEVGSQRIAEEGGHATRDVLKAEAVILPGRRGRQRLQIDPVDVVIRDPVTGEYRHTAGATLIDDAGASGA